MRIIQLARARVYVCICIQYAMRMLHIVTWLLPRSTIFSHIISQAASFWKKKVLKMSISGFFATLVWNIFHSVKNCESYGKKYILVFM